MLFAPFQFPLYRLSDEVGALFAIIKYGIYAVHGALGKAARNLLVVYLFSAHALKYLISRMLTSPSECDIIYLLDGR